jgi:MFS family permease
VYGDRAVPTSGWRRVALLLFVVGWGANHFGALLLVYRARLHLDPAAPQLIFGLYALGLVPGLMLSGPLSDRYGRRKVVLPAAAIALVASTLLGVGGEHFELLCLGRLVYGVAAGAVMNPGAVWVLELSAEGLAGAGARRATIALSAGFGVGPLISGALAQWAPYPVILPYVVHVVALVIAIAIAIGAPGGRTTAATPRKLLSIGLDASNRRRFVFGVGLMAPFVFAFPVLAFASIPAMLGPEALGSAPIAFIGLVGAITLAAGVLAQPLTRRFDPTTSSRIGLGFGAIGCAVAAIIVATHASTLLLIASAILGVGYGVCMTSGLRNVEVLAAPETRGAITGLYYVLTYIGFAVPYILALVTRSVAPATVLGGLAALAVVAAIALRKP